MDAIMEAAPETTVNPTIDTTTETVEESFSSEKFLTFVLEDEEYGIEILRVREIIGMMTIAPVPQSPMELKGIINLRGKIIPVFDLRLIFGMSERDHDNETCIIIVDTSNHQLLGIVVDTVSEVMNVNGNEIETGNDLSKKINTNFILGISKVKEKIRILIDIDKVLGVDDLSF